MQSAFEPSKPSFPTRNDFFCVPIWWLMYYIA